MKVIYLAGMGRSGSTIFESVLGEYEGCVPTGEVCFLWERGVAEDQLCSCRERFRECGFWSDVMSIVRDEVGASIEGAEDWLPRYGANRALPRLVWALATGRKPAELRRCMEVLASLYRAIGTVSGARLIIDSSKFPGYGLLLDRLPGLDVHTVHLIRDSRAVSNSCRKDRVYYDDGERVVPMRKHSLGGTVFRWYLYNLATELCGRFLRRAPLRIRYEAFVADPAAVSAEVFRFAGEDRSDEKIVDDGNVELHGRHIVSGNHSRFLVGLQAIRRDDSWLTQLGSRREAAVTALTYPLLRRYGYSGLLPLQRRG